MPAPPAGIVLRPRLAELLGDGLDGFTTLVCAPAGSGKTSLLSAELRREELPPPAWVSLGVGDDEPGRFWGMVLASLRAAGVVPEGSALDTLAPPVRESRRGFMPLLVNALAELEDPVVLVLDYLHLVRSRVCLSQLAFLLLHAPVTLRLVLSTRSDPALPLHPPGAPLPPRLPPPRRADRDATVGIDRRVQNRDFTVRADFSAAA